MTVTGGSHFYPRLFLDPQFPEPTYDFAELTRIVVKMSRKYTKVSSRWSVNAADISQTVLMTLLALYRDSGTPLSEPLCHPTTGDPKFGYRKACRFVRSAIHLAHKHRREIPISQLVDPKTAKSTPVGDYWIFLDDKQYRSPSDERELKLREFGDRLEKALSPDEYYILKSLHVAEYTPEMVGYVLDQPAEKVRDTDNRLRRQLRRTFGHRYPDTLTATDTDTITV